MRTQGKGTEAGGSEQKLLLTAAPLSQEEDAAFERRRDARIKTRRDVDVRRRKPVKWRTDSVTTKRGCVQSCPGGKNADQGGQTSRNKSRCDPHEEQTALCEHENGRNHVAEKGRCHVHCGDVDLGAHESFKQG